MLDKYEYRYLFLISMLGNHIYNNNNNLNTLITDSKRISTKGIDKYNK